MLTKNFVIFKRWDEVKDEKLWGSQKIPFLGGASRKTNV